MMHWRTEHFNQTKHPPWRVTVQLPHRMEGKFMKKVLIVGIVMLCISQQSVTAQTTDDNQAEELKTSQIAFTYKRCLKERESEGYKKTYSQSEIDNYCGCFSVQINERVTMEEYQTAANDGTWQKHPVLKEVAKYCRKYLNLPDVTAIRKKKW
jgi:hypothetical protein